MHINNYDVLIEASDDDTFRLANKYHVGNKRFEVLLNLHQQSYSNAKIQDKQDECNRIVIALVDIICHQCVPRGRFLERVYNDKEGAKEEWIELGEGELACLRVHHALWMQDRTIDKMFQIQSSMEATPFTLDNQDSTLKRRRWGSYSKSVSKLRRSLSEPITSGYLLEEADSNIVQTCNDMDVIFPPSSGATSSMTQTPGNYRFELLISMTTNQYVSSDSCGQRLSIVQDLIETVQLHWKGRFLVPDVILGQFRRLDPAEVQTFVEQALSLGSILHNAPVADKLTSAVVTEPIKVLSQGVESLRVAAIQSLKARKQKKAITDRMGIRSDMKRNGL